MKAGTLDLLVSRLASRVFRRKVTQRVALRTSPPPRHDLVLYDFEGSPWCRLVREYASILDLTLEIRPCPRETVFYGEGAYSSRSRFRPEAMKWYKSEQKNHASRKRNRTETIGNEPGTTSSMQTEGREDDHLTFPLLVDRTNDDKDDTGVVVLTESYDILCHLWDTYGHSVVPSGNNRPDQLLNSSGIPFPIRFLSLAGPSYARPWPRCGMMRFPSSCGISSSSLNSTRFTLYQTENCPESRLVREALCSLELPYRSVPVAIGSHNPLPPHGVRIPLLEIADSADKDEDSSIVRNIAGAVGCVDYLRETYLDTTNNIKEPSWFDPIPERNFGRQSGGSNSLAIGAYTAFWKGTRSFVPQRALE